MWWNLVASLVLMALAGVITGRLLGIRRGFRRSVATGLLGWFVGQLVSEIIRREATGGRAETPAEVLGFGLSEFGFAVLATMVLSILFELVLRRKPKKAGPSGRARLRAGFTVGRRLLQVGRIARRQGLAGRRLASRAALATPETARRVRRFLEDCGGLFVKFGQIAATRSDLLPPALVGELTLLQTQARPIESDLVVDAIERELGYSVDEVFASFDRNPLAAASIGQIHAATMPDGRSVVVKVRRPGVDVGVARDAAVMRWASRSVARRSSGARQLGLVPLADEVIESVRREMDFQNEEANNRALRSMPMVDGVAVPAVLDELTTSSVLVMERVDGRPLTDVAAVDACGVPREILADRLLQAFLAQVMRSGVFHADPHPGNILVDRAGTVWFIDFGAVGFLDPVTLEAVTLIGAGLGTGEPALLARALRQMAGSTGHTVDAQALTADLSKVLTDQMHSGGFSAGSIQKIIDVMGRSAIPVPAALIVLGRALVTLDGTLRQLDPRFDLATSASRNLGGLNALHGGSVRETLTREALRNLPTLRALPGLAEDVALQIRSGQLSVRIDPLSEALRDEVGGWVDRALFAAVGSVLLLASTGMLVATAFGAGDDGITVLETAGYVGLISSGIMIMRVIAQVLRREGTRE